MKYILSLFVIILLFGTIFPASVLSCESISKKYGNKLAIPASVSSYFYGESISISVPAYQLNEEMRISGTIGNGAITGLECGKSSDSNYEIHISYKAAVGLSKSKNQIQSFIQYMKKGEISVDANGFMPSLKLAFAKSVFGYYN